MSNTVDILAIGAHPDDVELACGGSLVKMTSLGHRTGALDLTRGELGSRGTPDLRAEEAHRAADIMGLSRRENAGLPDGMLSNSDASRTTLVEFIRSFRPRTVILPYPVGRHPDHRIASELGRDACFLSGLKNYPAAGEAFKPSKVIYTSAFREDAPQPSFVVDISDHFETKLAAIRCYESQFEGVVQAGELYPNGQDFLDLVRTQNSHYGTLIRKAYGEPYTSIETVEVDDLVNLGVASL
jgi:bacillithiol biosynthesis deacetylase BshB1